MKVKKQMKMTKGLSVTMTATLEEVEERDGIADVMLGLPVEHWHLLMQEGWQQLGLPGAEQPLLWPSPWRQHLCGGGVDLLLEQG